VQLEERKSAAKEESEQPKEPISVIEEIAKNSTLPMEQLKHVYDIFLQVGLLGTQQSSAGHTSCRHSLISRPNLEPMSPDATSLKQGAGIVGTVDVHDDLSDMAPPYEPPYEEMEPSPHKSQCLDAEAPIAPSRPKLTRSQSVGKLISSVEITDDMWGPQGSSNRRSRSSGARDVRGKGRDKPKT